MQSAVSCTRIAIVRERLFGRRVAIQQLREMDRMRLVPDDERIAARALASVRPDHLGRQPPIARGAKSSGASCSAYVRGSMCRICRGERTPLST